jgi:hypothetical protein
MSYWGLGRGTREFNQRKREKDKKKEIFFP